MIAVQKLFNDWENVFGLNVNFSGLHCIKDLFVNIWLILTAGYSQTMCQQTYTDKLTTMQLQTQLISTLSGHNGGVYDLDIAPEENGFYSVSSDKHIVLWNLNTMQHEYVIAKIPNLLYEICFIPEKKLLLAGTAIGGIHIIDLTNKKEIKLLKHHSSPIFEIKYSLKTNHFYTCSGNGELAICSLENLSLIKIKKLCNEKIRSIDFNYSANEMAVASGDGNIRIFDLQTIEEKKCFKAHDLSANIVRYTPNGKNLISGGRDAHLNIWDIPNYSLIKSIPAHNFAIYDIAFNPNGTLFATASRDKTIKIWDATAFDFLHRITIENKNGHTYSVNKLLWMKHNNFLISAGDDRLIRVWEVDLV